MTTTSTDNHLLRIICSVFDAYSAVLFLPDENGEDCTLAASFSLGDKIVAGASVAAGKGMVGWIVRNRKPMLVDNVAQRQSVLGYYADDEEDSIKAFMGVPVADGGALCVDSKRQYFFKDRDCKILQLSAELVASRQIQQNKEQLTGSLPRYFAELGVIQDLRHRSRSWTAYLQSYLEVMATATGFEYCAFATAEDEETFSLEGESRVLLMPEGVPVSLPMGGNLTGCVFRTEEPVIQEHLGEQALLGRFADMPRFRSVMCMPVRVNRSTRAVLCLGHTEPREIDEAMRSFVYQSVDLLALHLENLYLKNKLRRFMPKAQLTPPPAANAESEGK